MCGYTNVLSFTMSFLGNIDYDTSFDVQTEAK